MDGSVSRWLWHASAPIGSLSTSIHVVEPPRPSEKIVGFVEVCAGLEGISQGGFMTGIQPRVPLELSHFTIFYLTVHLDARALQGNLSSRADVGKISLSTVQHNGRAAGLS